MHKHSTPTHDLNYILFLDYKLTLHKYNINNTWFIGLKVCAIGKISTQDSVFQETRIGLIGAGWQIQK